MDFIGFEVHFKPDLGQVSHDIGQVIGFMPPKLSIFHYHKLCGIIILSEIERETKLKKQ